MIRYLVVLILINQYQIFGQSEDVINLSHDQLFQKINRTDNILEKIEYSLALVDLAKRQNDIEHLKTGYYLLSYFYKNENVLKYSDSLIEIAEKSPNPYLPGSSYFVKANYYYDLRNFKSALDNYLMAKKTALENQNPEFVFKANQSVANLKARIEDYESALELYQENLSFKAQNGSVNDVDYLNVIFGLANAYNHLKQLDSANYYNRIGIELAQSQNNDYEVNHFKLNKAVTLFLDNKPDSSLQIIDRIQDSFLNNEGNQNLPVLYYYKAKANLKKGNTQRGIEYLEKVDSLFIRTNYMLPQLLDSYTYLINYYEETNNKEMQLESIQHFIYADSILDSDYRYLKENINTDFDIPQLLNAKNRLISQLETSKKQTKLYLYVSLIAAAVLILLSFYFIQRSRALKTRFEKLIKAPEDEEKPEASLLAKAINTSENQNDLSKGSLDLPDDLISAVVEKLSEFEEKQVFLDQNLNLKKLADNIGTNTNYLSKIINWHTNSNFSTYLNELRVDYAFHRLKNDPKFRRYTIKAVAFESGFKSSESFSKYFYRKYDIYPSYFIKSLNKS
ncbi:helix-turn-helix domain-containing protein [Leeuwenhoekiella sp.]|uniref:helix-turn-helix domain-containing protein n=1 Tax=Leeuwenhoekiella sp. TaxID=1977054 RepID=UPI000C59D8EB|nr:helix-turn-helix domain-containing protein [Leeuwenhoekiella sp.]MAW95462.1 hypothetical protein [Leeuwenhoekiella sp.]MBA80849.1 hypothetical protein [Leeuwenhoekiella sp.]